MPLWFHPLPIPVDLGAPVYPSPLLYHPPPFLVDPRPLTIPETAHCTCHLSALPPPPPPPPPPGSYPHNQPQNPTSGTSISARIAATRLRKIRELEWEYEDIPRSETRVVEIAGSSSNLNIRISQRNPVPRPLYYEPVPETRPEARQHAADCNLTSGPARASGERERLRAQINAELSAQMENEKMRVARVRAEVKAEIKQEMEAENLARMEDLEKREKELEVRAEQVREKERVWIETYGKGVVEGGTSRQFTASKVAPPVSATVRTFAFPPSSHAPIRPTAAPPINHIPVNHIPANTTSPRPTSAILDAALAALQPPSTAPSPHTFQVDPFAPRPRPPRPGIGGLDRGATGTTPPKYNMGDLESFPENYYTRGVRCTGVQSVVSPTGGHDLLITISRSVTESESGRSSEGGVEAEDKVEECLGGKKVRWEVDRPEGNAKEGIE